MSGRAHHWCFTLNNWTDAEVAVLKANEHIRFIAYSKEHAPTTGTPHLQGFVQFYKQLRLKSIKRIPGFERARFEPTRGSYEQNVVYCTKENPLFTSGDPVKHGRRVDIEQMREMVEAGASDLELAQTGFGTWCVMRKAFQEYRILLGISEKPTRRDGFKLVIYHGVSGTGKTFRAGTEFPDAFWRFNDGTHWWDKYRGEDVIVIDEFKSWLPREFMLSLCSDAPMELPCRGRENTVCKALTVVITSNFHPNMWWPNCEDVGGAWARRLRQFGSVIHLTEVRHESK